MFNFTFVLLYKYEPIKAQNRLMKAVLKDVLGHTISWHLYFYFKVTIGILRRKPPQISR